MPWCILFAGNIVLIGEKKTVLNSKLNLWSKTLEDRVLKISRIETVYMEYKFNEN